MSNKNSKKNPYELNKSKLTGAEYQHYQRIGVPDPSQNWLELFTPAMVSDLFEIMKSSSDNPEKADYILKELAFYHFEAVGLGTNVLAVSNPAYPGVVFKIALDVYGLADNYNDEVLCDLVNDILVKAGKKPRYTKCLARHPTGIVSIQERKVLMKTQDRLDQFRGSILKTLDLLQEKFLIVDLSPTLYQFNYGIDRDGNWCFIDASDLYPLERIKMKLVCNTAVGSHPKTGKILYCGGSLHYNEDYSAVVCDRCGKEYIPSHFRPNTKEEEVMSMTLSAMDGTTAEEREEMRMEEMHAIKFGLDDQQRATQQLGRAVYGAEGVEPADQDDDDEESSKPVTFEVPSESEETDEDDETEEVPESVERFIDRANGRKATVVPPADEDEEDGESEDPEDESTPKSAPTVQIVSGIKRYTNPFRNPNEPKKDDQPSKPKLGVAGQGTVFRIAAGEEVTPVIPQPTIQQIRDTSTQNLMHSQVQELEPDEDEGEEDGSVEPIPSATAPDAEAPDMSGKMTYNVFRDHDGLMGVLINVSPEFMKNFDENYDENALSLWITVDGGNTKGVFLDASAMKKIFKDALEDAIEELN